MLAAYNLPMATSVVTRSVEEAMAAARQTRFPVALKISSPAVTHKTDVGGVRLNREDEASVRQAFSDVTAERAGTRACWCSRWLPAASRR